jgi:hypothetical protein
VPYDGLRTITVAAERGVAWATIDNPPLNHELLLP